tara:strand:+ start:473 stop:1798 length:1326 start_codon:yes stop_codon:yes gene_type:complete
MATTTSLVLIQRLSEAIGDYLSLTASDGTTTTVVDTDLANLTEDNGGVQGYVKIVTDAGGSGAAPEGQIRRIKNGTSGYTASSTTITVNFAFTASPATGDTYELHRYDPVVKRNAINSAIRQLWPSIYLPIRDESLVVDNLLSNSGFETAASSNVHPSWSKVGTPTIDDNGSIVRHLSSSARIIASGAAEGETQTVQVNIKELIGKTVHAAFWVYATTANWARIRVDTDGGTTFLSSDYHTGADEWQYLEIHETIPDAATQVGLRLEVADGGTAYFDAGWMAVGPIHKMTVPTSIVRGPYRVEQQMDESDPNGDYLNLDNPIRGHRLRVRGMGHLSQPSTDSGTVEVGDEYVDLIVAKAAQILFQSVSGDDGNPRHTPEYWREIVHGPRFTRGQGMIDMPGNRMVPPPIGRRKGSWHIEDDGSGRYIMLDGRSQLRSKSHR